MKQSKYVNPIKNLAATLRADAEVNLARSKEATTDFDSGFWEGVSVGLTSGAELFEKLDEALNEAKVAEELRLAHVIPLRPRKAE